MTRDRDEAEGQGIIPGLRAVPPKPELDPSQVAQLTTEVLSGGGTSRHLWIDSHDKLLVFVDPGTEVAVRRLRNTLAACLGIAPERIMILAGGRDIMTVAVDQGDDEGEREPATGEPDLREVAQ